MIVNPVYGAAGGSESIEYYLYDKEIADGSTSYITVNLDETIPFNTPVVICIYDPDENITRVATCLLSYNPLVGPETVIFKVYVNDTSTNCYELILTSSTIKLSAYTFGNWRKIYCRISRLIPNDGYIYGT